MPQRGPFAKHVLRQRARQLLREGRAGEAIVHLRQSLRATGGQGRERTLLLLGTALSRLARHGEALATLREAIRLVPDDADAHQGLARALEAQGDLQAARAAYDVALGLAPKRLALYVDSATLTLRAGDKLGARKIYERYEKERQRWVARLRSGSKASARAEAAEALAAARDDRSARALLFAIEDPAPAVKMAVVEALGRQGFAFSREPLTSLRARTADPRLRRALDSVLEHLAKRASKEDGATSSRPETGQGEAQKGATPR